jgi:1,4-dihydroxy-2-naphthoate octaprenyltransferase
VDFDAKNKTNTLVVLLGDSRARQVTKGLVAFMYISTVILVIVGIFLPTALLVLLALPLARRLWEIFSHPKPKERPDWAIGWPLYFVGVAFIHNRRFGMFYILGIILQLVVYAVYPGLEWPRLV